MARNKCKELYDKLDKGGWKVEDVAISNITIKDLEFTKPTMNAREVITVESMAKTDNNFRNFIRKQNRKDLSDLIDAVSKAIKDIDLISNKIEDDDIGERLFNVRTNLLNALPSTKTSKKMGWSESTGDATIEPVIFKRDKRDGEIVAFFPETMFDGSVNRGNIMCYAHNGQSSEASIEYFQECRPCKDEAEYADLLAELKDYFMQDPDAGDIQLKVVRKPRYGRGPTRRQMWPSRF